MTVDDVVKVPAAGVQSLAALRGIEYMKDVHRAAIEASDQYIYMPRAAYEALKEKWASAEPGPRAADLPGAPPYPQFARALVINRGCRADRWQRVRRSWAEVGMADVLPLERIEAVEGGKLPLPPWWYAGGPAWGCAQSHIRALEHCIVRGDHSALILEDDVCFTPDFASYTAQVLAAMPPDWDQLYLGGQYLQESYAPPWRMNGYVRMPYNVNRTHAYAVSRAGMHKLYAFLTDYPRWQRFRGNAHIDHYFGHGHNNGLWSVYTANHWTCGQGGGLSDLTGRVAAPVYWELGDCCTAEHTPVVIAGAMRSGTSVVAAVLDALGVYMGENLVEPHATINPDGFFEDRRVFEAYGAGFDVHTGRQLCHDAALIDALSCVRRAAFSRQRPLFGVKHHALMRRPDLVRRVIGGEPRIVHVVRDRAAAAASLAHAGWYPPADCRAITDTSADAIAQATAEFARVHEIRYADLLADPAAETMRLAEFVGADKRRVKKAVALVKPTRPWSANAIACVNH